MGLKAYPRAYRELLTAAFTLVMGMSLSAAFLPLFAKELDPSKLLVGMVSSAWYISKIFIELPSGIMVDRFGRRKLLVGGLALSAAGAFICSTAGVIHILIIGRTFWGLGASLFLTSNYATIFDLFKSSIRGRALGTFQAIQFVGSFIGVSIGSFMVAFTDYKGVFLAATALMVCSFIITLFSKDLRQIEEKNAEQARAPLTDVLSSLKSRGLIAIYVNSFFRVFIISGLMDTVFPLYLNLELGISVEVIGLIFSLSTLGIIIAAAVSGYFSDRIGSKPLIVLGILIKISCFYAYTVTSLLEALLLIGLVEGFSRGMILTSLTVLLSEAVSPKRRGGVIGMYRTFMDLGGFTGPLCFMFMIEQLGFYITFFSAIIILAANATLIMTVKKP